MSQDNTPSTTPSEDNPPSTAPSQDMYTAPSPNPSQEPDEIWHLMQADYSYMYSTDPNRMDPPDETPTTAASAADDRDATEEPMMTGELEPSEDPNASSEDQQLQLLIDHEAPPRESRWFPRHTPRLSLSFSLEMEINLETYFLNWINL